jgi:Zn-dependent protease
MTGFPVARVFGMEIRLHLSWLPVLVFLAVAVAADFAEAATGLADPRAWVVGLAVSLGFLGSVLVHELAHALVARRRGIRADSITLFFFGGTASLEVESERPADERAIALAGPVASAALGVALVVLAVALGGRQPEPVVAVRATALVLGLLNLVLAAINALPASPLDGGRALRAVVWSWTGSERRGTRAAAISGRLTGWALTLAGFWLALVGAGLDGVMLILSGWFVGSASRVMDQRLQVEDLVRGLRVEEVMERDLPSIAPQLTVDTFGDQLVDGTANGLLVMAGDRMLGLVGPRQVRRLARRAWATTRAGELMVGRASLPEVGPDEPLWPALELLRRSGLDALPVLDASGFLGVLTRRAAMAAIARRAADGRPTP